MLKLTIKAKMLSTTCWELHCCFLLWLIKDPLWEVFVFMLPCLGAVQVQLSSTSGGCYSPLRAVLLLSLK